MKPTTASAILGLFGGALAGPIVANNTSAHGLSGNEKGLAGPIPIQPIGHLNLTRAGVNSKEKIQEKDDDKDEDKKEDKKKSKKKNKSKKKGKSKDEGSDDESDSDEDDDKSKKKAKKEGKDKRGYDSEDDDKDEVKVKVQASNSTMGRLNTRQDDLADDGW